MKSSELAHEALMKYRYAQKDMQRLADKIATLRATDCTKYVLLPIEVESRNFKDTKLS